MVPRFLPTVVLTLALSAQLSFGATRHVPGDFATIQAALNASTASDAVVVGPGTYAENLVITSAQDGVALTSSSGAQFTTIDGGRLGSVIQCSGVGPQMRIEGFTITNGGVLGDNTIGAGLILSSASPTIRNNVITANHAEAAGGIYVDGGSPLIVGNTISNNEAPRGSGGGIYCDHSANATIQSNVIVNNTCGAYGGGVTIWENSAPQLLGNTIANNSAAITGGGVYLVRGGQAAITQCIVTLNSPGGIQVDFGGASATLSCSDVFANVGGNYIGLPDATGQNGVISVDPVFCGASAENYELSTNSPCVAPQLAGGCGPMGALGVGCGATPVHQASWGQVKAKYR